MALLLKNKIYFVENAVSVLIYSAWAPINLCMGHPFSMVTTKLLTMEKSTILNKCTFVFVFRIKASV